MRFVIVAVGRLKDRTLRITIDDYLERIRRYVPCEEVEIAETSLDKVRSGLVRATEDAHVVALEVNGKALDSKAFANAVERLGCRGKGVIAWMIGGADGLPKDISAAADERWSLSALTFPHRLARLILFEQLYRAMTILRGEPYNRE